MIAFADERALADVAVQLGAKQVTGWSPPEQALAEAAAAERGAARGHHRISQIRAGIRAGEDPLGEAFCLLRPPVQRRRAGQTFTPPSVTDSMIRWAGHRVTPARVVDPGTGSARFLVAAGRRWPGAELVGVETDPLAAMVGRSTLAVAGMAGRARIVLADYRSLRLPAAPGPTLFLGNPPYVRHHHVPAFWKDWLKSTALHLGFGASGLAGLHAHFFLATALLAKPGDAGVLVTAAEWLDVNYGSLLRGLLLGPLGGESVHVLDPSEPVFADAAVTSVIVCFLPGTQPGRIRLRRVATAGSLGDLSGGTVVAAAALRAASRWGPLVPPSDQASGHRARPSPARRSAVQKGMPAAAKHPSAEREDPPAVPPEDLVAPTVDVSTLPEGLAAVAPRLARRGGPPRENGKLADDYVELGELCRVHRGQVTGANKVWITSPGQSSLPARLLFPAITRAAELFRVGDRLSSTSGLRCVIDLPADLTELSGAERALVRAFLARARAAGAADSYIAVHRNPWWRVRLRAAAPIVATYMARRPPTFVRNLAAARHINIAHGLYPREPLPPPALDGLAAYLRHAVTTGQGRTYAGGLTKFEPGEMERLPVPAPGLLPTYAPVPSSPSRAERNSSSCPAECLQTGPSGHARQPLKPWYLIRELI